MIRSAIRNYFKELRHVLSGMGVVYLAMLIGIYLFLAGAGNIFKDAIEVSIAELQTFVETSFDAATFESVFYGTFLIDFLRGILEIFGENGLGVLEKLFGLAVGIFALLLFSLKLAGTVMRHGIVRDMSDRDTKNGVVRFLIRYLASFVFYAGAIALAVVWIYSTIFIVVLFIVLSAVKQLFNAWYLYHKKSVPFRKMLSPLKVLNLVAANFVSVALNLCVVALLTLITNIFYAVLLAIPLIVYGFTVLDFTAVDYFKRVKLKNVANAENDFPSSEKILPTPNGEDEKTLGKTSRLNSKTRDKATIFKTDSSSVAADAKTANPSNEENNAETPVGETAK